MNITIENKKQKAIELMNKLDIYKPYIKGFKENNQICFSHIIMAYLPQPVKLKSERWAEPHLSQKYTIGKL